MAKPREQRVLSPVEAKLQAWHELHQSAVWSVLLLAVTLVMGAVAFFFYDLLPEWLSIVLALLALASGLQLLFLYPILFAFADLFTLYIGRWLWQFLIVRCLVWLGLAAFGLAVVYTMAMGP